MNSNNGQARSWMKNLVDEANDQTEAWSEYNRALVYGEFGVGKTRFCGVPDVFIFDYDDGLTTLRKSGKVPPTVQFRQEQPIYEPTMQVISDLQKRSGPFSKDGVLGKTRLIALDGITALAELLMHEISRDIIGEHKDITAFKPQFDEWGILKKRLNEVIEGLKLCPYHLVVTAMSKFEQDSATKAYVGGIDILGSYRNTISRRFDEVWYVEKRRASNSEREATGSEIANDFYLNYHPRFPVKSRLSSDESLGIPNKVPNPTWDTLVKPLYRKRGGWEA